MYLENLIFFNQSACFNRTTLWSLFLSSWIIVSFSNLFLASLFILTEVSKYNSFKYKCISRLVTWIKSAECHLYCHSIYNLSIIYLSSPFHIFYLLKIFFILSFLVKYLLLRSWNGKHYFPVKAFCKSC